MKVAYIAIALFCSPGIASAMSFWAALAQIESGGNDYAVGDVGEVSRYQIRPEVWETYSSSHRYSDPVIALSIAERYMAKLKRDFEHVTGRPATEYDCVILWKAGIAGYEKRGFNASRMSAAHHDRIVRFRNLRGEEMLLTRVARQTPTQSAVAESAKPKAAGSSLQNFFSGPGAVADATGTFFRNPSAIERSGAERGLFALAKVQPVPEQSLTPYLR